MKTSIRSTDNEISLKNNVTLLREEIAELVSDGSVIVGIGNSLRGDDGAGPSLIQNISDKIGAICITVGSVPENYIEKIISFRPQTVLFVDAADFYGTPGEIRIFDPNVVTSSICSTHAGSLRMIAAYIKMRIQATTRIIAIQAVQTEFNTAMSGEVQQAVDLLTAIFFQVSPHA
jgi:hydrogenase 3 maturation protease